MPFDSAREDAAGGGAGDRGRRGRDHAGGRVPFLGSLPGDLSFERDGVKVYIPIVTSIVLSIVLTVVLNLVFGMFGRR